MKTSLSAAIALFVVLLFTSIHVSALEEDEDEETCTTCSTGGGGTGGGSTGGGTGGGGIGGGTGGGASPPDSTRLENMTIVSTFLRSQPDWVRSPPGGVYVMNTLRPAITPVATPATPTKPSVGGSLCRAAYVAGAAIFCGAYMATCGVGTVFTVGTITIPCVAVAVGACGIIGGSYQFLAEQSCKP